jgi:acyl-CoA thioester hydrolase
MNIKELKPSDFKLTVDIQVRFRDTDAMGHINNAVYLAYLELARMAYWVKISESHDYSKVNFILGRVQIEYKSPGKLGDSLVVGVRCPEIRGASFDFEYLVWEKSSLRLIAEARTTQVMYDYRQAKPMRLPQEYRGRMLAFEGK